MTTPPAQLLIDGKLVPASDGATYPILNPATGRGDRPGARRHGRGHRRRDRRRPPGLRRDRLVDRTVELRVRCLRQLHQALLDHARGAPGADHRRGRGAGVHDVRGRVRRAGRGAALGRRPGRVLRLGDRPRCRRADGHPEPADVRREPVGVVAAITPWNFPTRSTSPRSARRSPPATRSCSSRRRTPRGCACELGPARRRAHRPPAGRAQRRHAARPTRSAAVLTTDPRVDMVSFTGSTATGRAIMAAAAPTLKKVFLELGGKSARDRARRRRPGRAWPARRAFTVAHPRRPGLRDHDPAARPAREVRRGRPGRRRDDGVDRRQGPGRPGRDLRPGDLAGAARPGPRAYLELAGRGGRHVRHRRPTSSSQDGFWVEPTVVAGLDNYVAARAGGDLRAGARRHPARRRRRRGPDRQRLARTASPARSTRLDLERARAVAGRIRTGTLAVNGGVWFGPDAPFGGYKQSGIGREMGVAGLRGVPRDQDDRRTGGGAGMSRFEGQGRGRHRRGAGHRRGLRAGARGRGRGGGGRRPQRGGRRAGRQGDRGRRRPGVFVRTDVSSAESAAAMAEATVAAYGGIDLLVNNAAIYGDMAVRPADQRRLGLLPEVHVGEHGRRAGDDPRGLPGDAEARRRRDRQPELDRGVPLLRLLRAGQGRRQRPDPAARPRARRA